MPTPRIHPTAIVDPQARLADDVEVGPFCVVEADVVIGPATRLAEHVVVRRHTSIGARNVIDAHTVLGGEPQDFKFDPATVSYLRIGDDNVFREGVTISRATGDGGATVVGSRTYWMAGSHAGHNATVEDEAVLVNGSALAGHARLGAGSILSAHVVIHQFCWVGRRVMSEGNAAARSHIPPYTMLVGRNQVFGLNAIGLRRADDLTNEDRRQIKEAYRITYRSDLSPAKALAKMDACTDWGKAAAEFRQFVRDALTAEAPYDRGLCPARPRAGSA